MEWATRCRAHRAAKELKFQTQMRRPAPQRDKEKREMGVPAKKQSRTKQTEKKKELNWSTKKKCRSRGFCCLVRTPTGGQPQGGVEKEGCVGGVALVSHYFLFFCSLTFLCLILLIIFFAFSFSFPLRGKETFYFISLLPLSVALS